MEMMNETKNLQGLPLRIYATPADGLRLFAALRLEFGPVSPWQGRENSAGQRAQG